MVNLTRRHIITSLAVLPSLSFAQSKRLTLVVPYSAGGGTDTIARIIGEHMSRTLGYAVIIENSVGAGGTLANERVAKSAPDGATVLINHVGLLAAPSLFTNLRYDTIGGFQPVGLVNNAPMVLMGRKTIPANTQKEMVEWIKSQGAKLNIAHGGIGSNNHLCGVMMGNVLGFKPTFIPYRGSAPAITDLLAGTIDLMWDQLTSGLPHIQGGALHGIAVTSQERMPQLPNVPTTKELGLEALSYTMWHGFYMAKGTPQEAFMPVNNALRNAVSDPAIIARMNQLGTLPFKDAEMSPEAHAKLFASDMPRVAKLVESSGIKAEEAK